MSHPNSARFKPLKCSLTQTKVNALTSLASLFSTDNLSRARYLRLLCWIRFIALVGQAASICFAKFQLQLQMDYSLLWMAMLGLVWLTLFSWHQSGQTKVVSESAYGMNLAMEIVGFSILIYLSGGATNPFVFYYLVPLSIGVVALSKRNAWALSGLCIGIYTLLLFQYQPLPLFDMSRGLTVSWKSPHILGMWMNFVVSALLITYFISRMAGQIRSQERELATRDQQQREDQHFLAMGTFAAGTAHELGTPLSSLAIILQDLSQQIGLNNEQKTELEIACGEVNRCKTILQRLVSAAHSAQNSERWCSGVTELLNQLCDQTKNLFPSAEIELEIEASTGKLSVESDTALQQSLLNLVSNAFESSRSAGSSKIHISAQPGDDGGLIISIRDFGEGVSHKVLSKLGKLLVSDKAEGLGLGYFLANAFINRIGGQLAIRNLEGGGAEP